MAQAMVSGALGTSSSPHLPAPPGPLCAPPCPALVRADIVTTRAWRTAEHRPGEDIRFLPRSRAADLVLPDHEFWIFDDTCVYLMHFDDAGCSTDSTGCRCTARKRGG